MEEMQYVGLARSAEAAPLAEVRLDMSPRRWVVLGLFSLLCVYTGSLMAWHSVAVGDPGPQQLWVTLAVQPALALPFYFLLDAMGLRWGVELSGTLLVLGSWLQLRAVSGRLNLELLGQGLVAASQIFQLATPTRLASTWFGAHHLSTVCAIGVLAPQAGYILGFLLPPMSAQLSQDDSNIGPEARFCLRVMVGVSAAVLLLIILLFKDKPELPPSHGQALERCSAIPVTLKQFTRSLGELLSNRNYLLVMAASGINGGALNAIYTVLNPVILHHFPKDGEELAGHVRLVLVLSAVLGATGFGVLLDRTHTFKETMLGVCVFAALSYTGFAFALTTENVVLVYCSAGFLGLFLLSWLVTAFEIAAEVTYPVSESTMGGLLLIPANILGCIITVTFTWVMKHWGYFTANMLLSASLLLGAMFCTFVTKDYRRLAANNGPVKT